MTRPFSFKYLDRQCSVPRVISPRAVHAIFWFSNFCPWEINPLCLRLLFRKMFTALSWRLLVSAAHPLATAHNSFSVNYIPVLLPRHLVSAFLFMISSLFRTLDLLRIFKIAFISFGVQSNVSMS